MVVLFAYSIEYDTAPLFKPSQIDEYRSASLTASGGRVLHRGKVGRHLSRNRVAVSPGANSNKKGQVTREKGGTVNLNVRNLAFESSELSHEQQARKEDRAMTGGIFVDPDKASATEWSFDRSTPTFVACDNSSLLEHRLFRRPFVAFIVVALVVNSRPSRQDQYSSAVPKGCPGRSSLV